MLLYTIDKCFYTQSITSWYYFYCNEGINPATNSLSASGKSKGTLLNSANIEINRIELSK